MKMDDLVKTYIQVREKKSRLKAEYDARVAECDKVQDKIEALLLLKFDELGTTSFKTPEGTAAMSLRTSVSIADWDTFFGFVKDNDAFDLLDRRASKTAIEQFKSANGELPPGLNYSATRVVGFTRPKINHS